MADQWSVIIGDSPDATTIGSPSAFELSFVKNFTDSNRVESIDCTLRIRGDIISDVAAGFLALTGLATLSSAPVHVQVLKDSVVQHDWSPEAGLIGPHVITFESVPDQGNAHSHWKYELVIVYRMNAPGNDDVYSLTTSFTTLKDNGRTVREVWRASAKARTRSIALAAVMAYKPTSSEISEQITESSTEASAEAIWIWEALQEILCRVHRTGAKDAVSSGQVGKGTPPVLHDLTDKARVVTISGTVRGYSPNLSAPPAHLQESDTVIRVDAREGNEDLAIETAEKGIYELRYQEVYLVSGDVPDINHAGNHQLIDLGTAPQPGNILT